MKKYWRILISVLSLILSIPAFFAIYAGFVITYWAAILSGYKGSLLDAFIKLVTTNPFTIIVILTIFYIVLFLKIIIRFSCGLSPSRLSEMYCLAIIILAIFERIRLLIVNKDAPIFWFGLFSLPHVACLILIIIFNKYALKKHELYIQDAVPNA